TLVDSEPLSRRAWELVLAPRGYEVTDEDLVTCVGRAFPHTHAHFAARVALPPAAELFELLDAELEPFPDAVAAAFELKRRGVALAVASSSARERLQRTLRRAGLSELFAVTVAGDEVPRGKPAPDMFLAAAEGLGLAPSSCVGVEDSAPGVQSALAAGLITVAVAREQPMPAGLQGAHLVVSELSADVLMNARAS
nr:HAD family phosphatase [Solirubrobacterales bacterium]